MMALDKRSLSERDICTTFITPAVRQAGWGEMLQVREEVGFTRGRIIVRGKLVTRGKAKRGDHIVLQAAYSERGIKASDHGLGDRPGTVLTAKLEGMHRALGIRLLDRGI